VLAERLDEGPDLLGPLLVGRAGEPRWSPLPGAGCDLAACVGANARDHRSGSAASGRTGDRCVAPRAGTAPFRCSPAPGTGKPTSRPGSATLVAYIAKHREGGADTPFEIVLGGASPADPAEARETIATLADAGATWWDERQVQGSDDLYRQVPVLRRIDMGPPSV
jgi:hypothetical protein